MMEGALFGGVNAAAITIFNDDLTVNAEKTARHCRELLNNGCEGLAILGTTGEANSLGLDERIELLESMISLDIPATKLLPGTSTPAISDTVKLTRHAEKVGCKGVLVLPPFYYKSPSEEGLFNYFSEVIEQVSGDIKFYLYNFPQQSAVPLTVSLIERLLRTYAGKLKGIKDSSGDFENTKSYIDNFSKDGFEVYTGADASIQKVLKAGGAGCITAMPNVASQVCASVCKNWNNGQGDKAQEALAIMRQAISFGPTVPAIKAVASYQTGDAAVAITRPPLCQLSEHQKNQIINAFNIAVN
ncbi:dihydrodipicolinate synthase family protein [Klebsiella pneumoniae]